MTFKSIGASAATGTPKRPDEDGRRPGGTELSTLHQSTNAIGQWMAGRSPAEVDAAILSQMKSRGVNASVKWRGMFPSGPNGEKMDSYQVAVGCDMVGSPEARAELIAGVEATVQPTGIPQIERWLAELSTISAGRNRQGIDAALSVEAYASRLSRYPVDVVRHALVTKSWQWFPTWAELERVCEVAIGPRRCMLEALRRDPPPEPERRSPTAEERARVQEMINEMFPNILKEWRQRAAEHLAGAAGE